MKILLDTHMILWAFTDSEQLSEKARRIIEDRNNTIYYSVLSAWEVSIKHMLHPDRFILDASEFCRLCTESGFIEVTLKNEHVRALETLKKKEHSKKHNDPFDRMLISQAKTENMTLLTHDKMARLYDEHCLMYV